MFVNLVALKCYYTVLNLLKKHELNRKFSPQYLFLFLSELKKMTAMILNQPKEPLICSKTSALYLLRKKGKC
jgi:hypothetical protein